MKTYFVSNQVSLQHREAVVQYNPNEANLDDMCRTIATLGPFSAQLDPHPFRDLVVYIEGKLVLYNTTCPKNLP